jgi:response regulator RpfG family c-di-GMP phosphodiesterase
MILDRSPSAPGPRPTILLVVNKGADLALEFRALLRNANVEVLAVGTSKQAERFLKDRVVDAVLVDENVDANGVEVLEALRWIRPDVPRVFVARSQDSSTLARAAGEGVVSVVLLRPLDDDQLVGNVLQVLQRRRGPLDGPPRTSIR